MTNMVRRKLWSLGFKVAVAAGFGLAFCARYLAAPLSLGERATDKTVDNSPMEIQSQEDSLAARSGRLTARPLPVAETAPRGLLRLGLGTLRDGLLYVPASYQANQPAPLVLSLHGAGGNAQQGMRLLQEHADRNGFLVLAVDSRGSTWDMLRGGYGPDVEFINRALIRSFERYAIDPERVAVAGFSDGASYALSLGLTNGDLFRHVVAFSPGFMAPAAQRGQPPIFISHGKGDKVLPIDKCSRRIVPQLQRAGYGVLYREFDGPHTIPAEIEAEAVEWWFARGTIQKPA